MSDIPIGPCPVCGGAGRVFFNDNGENHVWCGDWNCMSGPFRKTEADAIAAWNRLSGLAAEVARLRAVAHQAHQALLSRQAGSVPGGEEACEALLRVLYKEAPDAD